MRRGLRVATWLCAALALSCAPASTAGGVSIGFPVLELGAEAGFKPKALSRATPEPMQVKLEAETGTTDGSHPRALTELTLEADKNLTVDARGVPACHGGRQQRGIEATEAACGLAIIGKGEITVETAFPETAPMLVDSKLLLINRGVSGGKTTWFLYAYFNPSLAIGGELIIPMEITKHRDGRFGTRAVATIPTIGDGYGSVVSLQMTIAKNVEGEDGEIHHPITGRCADGKLQLGVEANFADGEQRLVEIVRSCTPKG